MSQATAPTIAPLNVLHGKDDDLERFAYDYLVGLFDEASPLELVAPLDDVTEQEVFSWRGMTVRLCRVPPGRIMLAMYAVDVVEVDILAPVRRTIDGVDVPQSAHAGAQAVRYPAGTVGTREAPAESAGAWLQFRAAA
jgi:hypothetical protein